MAEEQVFHFLAVRQPAVDAGTDTAESLRVPYAVAGEEPQLARDVQALPVAERTRTRLERMGRELIEGDRYVRDLAALPLDLAPLSRWAETSASRDVAELDLEAAVREACGTTPAELMQRDSFFETAARLAESLFAHAITDGNRGRGDDDLIRAVKLLGLVRIAAGAVPPPAAATTLGALLGKLVVVLPDLAQPLREARKPQPPTPRPGDAAEGFEGVRKRIEKLAAAHRELTMAIRLPGGVVVEEVELDAGASTAIGAAEVEAEGKRKGKGKGKKKSAARWKDLDGPPASALKTTLTASGAGRIGADAVATLANLDLDLAEVDPFAAAEIVEAEIEALAAQLPRGTASQRLIKLGGGATIRAKLFEERWRRAGEHADEGEGAERICDFKAGVGDLLIVRQRLKAYQLGDIAHVENVLRGEFREREHRRLTEREETFTVEEERTTEQQRDLESTERFELQTEATKSATTQFGLEAGLQVSGSYGPTIDFSASLNTSFGTTTTESQRRASSYSRQVTERAAARLSERVREERSRRSLEQIEETNVHRIDNSKDPVGHTRGIYRWLNKVYDAQVFNYGQRMMYEFVIPEPAAYFLYAAVAAPSPGSEVEMPEPPTHEGRPLRPKDIDRSNYGGLLAEYDVTSGKPPPPEYKRVAFFEKKEGATVGNYARTSKVSIPDGYAAEYARVWRRGTREGSYAFTVSVGSETVSGTSVGFLAGPESERPRSELSIGVYGSSVVAFAVTGDVVCVLTAEGLAEWQNETFGAIIDAYLNKKAAAESALAERDIQEGVEIQGRNPLESRRVERDELKKLAIMMLLEDPKLEFNGYLLSTEPLIDLIAACENGSTIRFLENAFEWSNMTFVHYPYFWGRREGWRETLQVSDADPDFAAFLRAGATRVQVPVRPGFERAVGYFCKTGMVWEGNDVPMIEDDLYVPIAEEISAKLGKLDDGKPYPPESGPWEVTLPTDLTLVQDLDEIPEIVDAMSGDSVSLGPG